MTVAANEEQLFRGIGACNETIGTEDWVRIAPYGEWPNKVGLQVFDRTAAEAIVSAFNSVATKASTLFRGLPIFEGHPDEPDWVSANPGHRRVAVGRVKELQPRDDGLWGKVAFNDLGTGLVRGEAPAYEAQSPRWGMMKITHKERTAFRPMVLHSLGLTNTPNIPGTQLGLNERQDELSPTMKQHIIALLAALGRPVTNPSAVTDEQLAAAVNEATPVATVLVTTSNEHATLKPQLTTALNEVTTLKGKVTTVEQELATVKTTAANERSARADAVLTVAINSGKITEAQRAEWKTKLTAAEDFAVVEGEIVKLKKAVNTTGRVAGIGARKEEIAHSNDTITAINEAVRKHIKEQGLDPVADYNAAFAAVKKAQPALFEVTA